MAEEPVGAPTLATEPVTAEEPITADPQDGEEVDPQASENEGEPESKPKKLGGWQRKELKAKAEAGYWRNVAMDALKAKPAVEEPKPKVEENKRPRKQDFIVDQEAQTYDADKYEEALLEWTRNETKKSVLEEIDKREQQKSQKTQQEQLQESWKKREAPFEAEHEDYAEVAQYAANVLGKHAQSASGNVIGAAITDSEIGPELMYHLGQNPEQLNGLLKLGPIAAIKELTKIELSLAKPEPAETEPEPQAAPPVSKAPKPITPVKKAAPTATKSIFDPDLPWKQFVKLREAGKTS